VCIAPRLALIRQRFVQIWVIGISGRATTVLQPAPVKSDTAFYGSVPAPSPCAAHAVVSSRMARLRLARGR
jgi:hypothetical protein